MACSGDFKCERYREILERDGNRLLEEGADASESKFLNTVTAPWGGVEGFKNAVTCIWKCGLPGDGSIDAQLGAFPPIVGIPVRAASSINITSRGLAHVLDRHVAGGARTAGKSLFGSNENIAALVKGANSAQRVQQAGGNFERVVDAGRVIGVDRATGNPTSVYTVITNAGDELITAFPGRP